MSSFASSIPAVEGFSADRAARTDALILQNRRRTSADELDKRAVRRMSIAEINAADLDELKQSLAKSRLDDRPPFIKALDLVDLPRNALFNVVAPGIADRKRKELEFGAAELPVVRTSDILRELGVQNRAALAIGGFVGDVALDPLAFVGPAKAVGLTGTLGRGVVKQSIKNTGMKSLRKGVRAAVQTGDVNAVRNPEVRAVLGSVFSGDDAMKARKFARLSQRENAEQTLMKALRATDNRRGLVKSAFRSADNTAPAGSAAARATEQTLATRQFLDKFGRRGSGVAHIPFTSLELRVPGLTPGARERSRLLTDVVRAGDAPLPTLKALKAWEDVHTIRLAQSEWARDTAKRLKEIDAESADELSAANAFGIPFDETPFAARRQAVLQRHADMRQRFAKKLGAIRKIAKTEPPTSGLNFNQLLAVIERREALASRAEREVELARELSKPERAGNLMPTRSTTLDEQRAVIRDRAWRTAELNDVELAENAALYEGARRALNATIKGGLASERNMLSLADELDLGAVAAVQSQFGANDAMSGSSLILAAGTALAQHEKSPRLRRLGQTLVRIDDGIGKAFGRRGTLGDSLRRQLEATQQEGARISGARMSVELRRQLREIADEFGLKDADAVDKLGDAVNALMHERHMAIDPTTGLATKAVFSDDDLIYQRLQDLLASGYMQNPDMLKRLRALAERNIDFLNDIGQMEVRGGVLPGMAEYYVPNVLTPAGSQSVAVKRAFPGFVRNQDGSPAGPLASREPFQHARTTTRYRVYVDQLPGAQPIKGIPTMTDTNGRQYQRFHEFDRRFSNGPKQELIRAYEALPPEQRVPPSQLSNYEVNRMFNDGELEALRFDDFEGRQLFETNAVQIMGARMAQHERAMAAKKFLDDHLKFGLAYDMKTGLREVGPGEYMLANGARARVDRLPVDGKMVPHWFVGGRMFRPLQLPADNPLSEMIGAPAMKMLYDTEVAERVERAAKLYDEENFGLIAATADELTKMWKKLTLAHPSWFVMDAVGAIFNGAVGGVRPQDVTKYAPTAMKAVLGQHNPASLSKMSVDVPGLGKMDGLELVELLTRQGLINQSLAAAEILEHAKAGSLSSDYVRATAALPSGARGASDIPGARKVFGRDVSLSTVPVRTYLNSWYAANGKMNDAFKLIGFMSFMEQGHSLEEAVRLTNRVFFDYGNMTQFEKGWLRRIFPFASWLRNNSAFQMKMLLERPGFANTMTDLQAALEEGIVGEQAVPMSMRPRWMREQLATQIAGGDFPLALMLSSTNPQEQLFELLQGAFGFEGAQDTLHYFGSSLNPVASIPLQIGAGTEFFTGRSIGPDVTSGDISVPEFLMSQVRPFREFGVGSVDEGPIQRAFEAEPGLAAARGVLGGRVQEFTPDRLSRSVLREFQDREVNIRRAIGRAERAKNEAVSFRARLELLELYREMMRNGYEAEVPVWARGQLSEGAR